MPLFAWFDSIYTEPTSETHPEFSLSLRDGAGTEAESSGPTLVDRDPSSIHNELIEFDPLEIPEPIRQIEPGSYQPINPLDYVQPDVDPVTQMELALEQMDALARQAANTHKFKGEWHMWDFQDGPGQYHKHDPSTGHTIYTYVNGNDVNRDVIYDPDVFSRITAESEGGGARIAAKDALAVEALEQAAIEMSYNESLRGDNRFVFEPFHAMSNLGESPVLKEASNWDFICDIGTSIKQANATHQLQDLGYW